MEFKKYIPSIEVKDNGTTKFIGGTLNKGSTYSDTKTSGSNFWKSRSSRTEHYVRNACRVLINNKPVTDWIMSSNYWVGTHSVAAHNNNNH